MKLAWLIVKNSPKELKFVFLVLFILLSLPLISVVVLASSGIEIAGGLLATVNPVTHLIEVKDPNGNTITNISTATAWPVCGVITTEFGTPHMPFEIHHSGIDIAANGSVVGDAVTPFMAGRVMSVIDSNKGYGKHVIIDHGYGITSLYGHMSALRASVGQQVKPGDIIGLEGSTGLSTGPHVHFEMRITGIPVNPRIFMIGNPILCNR